MSGLRNGAFLVAAIALVMLVKSLAGEWLYEANVYAMSYFSIGWFAARLLGWLDQSQPRVPA